LVIAKFQCDVRYLGQQEARLLFLPLERDNWITCGNALRLDWLSVCPATGTRVRVRGDDLLSLLHDEAEVDFENEGGETYICGNPPYLGSTWQSDEQKDDLKLVFGGRTKLWKSLDYVAGWFMKAADYGMQTKSAAAFVSTNSICQGQQVPILWPLIFGTGHEISFAHTSFKWANLASHNAGVTVAIVGISNHAGKVRQLFSIDEKGGTVVKDAENINAYLIAGLDVIVSKASKPLAEVTAMDFGSKPVDGGNLFLSFSEKKQLIDSDGSSSVFVKTYSNSEEFINGKQRFCIWIKDANLKNAQEVQEISKRLVSVARMRESSKKTQTNASAAYPHRFGEIRHQDSEYTLVIPRVSSENRPYLPVGLVEGGTIIGDRNFALYDAPLWNMALIASRLHWVWIGTVCVRMRTDFSYSNTLGWNTFPVPTLTDQNKTDLTRCAEEILLAREHYFPATIAHMYDPTRMDSEFPLVREAHNRNDEVIDRIYIGRRFKNDTERLEKLFDLYTKMTAQQTSAKKSMKRKG
jgi:hypothetical protein